MWIFEFIFEYPFFLKKFNRILTDKEKLKLISISKLFYQNRTKFIFHDFYICKSQDQNKWYYNCLTKVYLEEKVTLPILVTHIHFDYYFDDDLENYIPNTVITVIFDVYFKKCWKPRPSWMTLFRSRLRGQLQKGVIPNSVKRLNIGQRSNKTIKDCIPNSVNYLNLGDYNKSFDGFIPSSVEDLILPNFNQPLTKNSIPKTIKQIVFGDYFNQEIDDCIPSSVTYLIFGKKFDKDINNFLKENKTIFLLEFSKIYDKKIFVFPSSLKYLICSKEFFEINKDVITDKVKFVEKC